MQDENGLSKRHTKPFLEHLQDLRRAILWGLAFLVLGMIVAIPLAPWVMEVMKVPLAKAAPQVDPEKFLRVLTVTGGFSLAMKIILWSGVLISLPFILCAIGTFVFPGLTARERKAILCATGFATVLFVGGVVGGYFFVLPVGLQVMFEINRWIGVSCEFVDVGDYVTFVLQVLICFGLAFELPVVLVVLGNLGIVSSDFLRKGRRAAIVILLIVAMVLTPTTDAVSMLVMAVPMILLYELCIWLVWWKEKKEEVRGQKSEVR